MNQVSMSRVNLNHTEARFARPTRRSGKRGNDGFDTVDGECLRHRIVICERQCARGNDIVPAPLTYGDRSVGFPRSVGAGLAPGMTQLHSSHPALLMNKPDDPSQRLNVIVRPDTQVLRTNPALGENCSGFGEHQSSTADSTAAQMHEMPVVRVSISAGILAHRRDKYAVRKRNIPNCERIEQMSHDVVCYLETNTVLTPAIRLYESMGFKPIDPIRLHTREPMCI